MNPKIKALIINDIACVNGVISPLEEAKISVSDRGFLFGHSIFETLLVLDGKIIAWDEHYARMQNSCKNAFLSVPDESILKKWVDEVIKKSFGLYGNAVSSPGNAVSSPGSAVSSPGLTGGSRQQLRIIVSGGSSFALPIQRKNGSLPESNVVIFCRKVPDITQAQREKGVTLKSIPDLRSQALLNIKHCSYLYNILALESAKSENFDDAIFFNAKNYFTECTTANFIWFDRKYTVYSAPFEGNCLPGTTLSRLIVGLEKKGISFVRKELKREKLSTVRGCAILSSIRNMIPVQKIDEHIFEVEAERKFFAKMEDILA